MSKSGKATGAKPDIQCKPEAYSAPGHSALAFDLSRNAI
jgi:hypothetical protein